MMTLFDDMNNWVADLPTPKYLLALTETQSTDRGEPVMRPHKVLGDDTYGMNPVNYVKVDPLPRPDDMGSLINALKRGDVGRHRFQIPFDAMGKKWVRFAVWDSAGNGAFVQPIKLQTPTSTSAAR